MAMTGGDDVTRCLTIIKEMSDAVADARKALVNSEACVVNRHYLLDRLDQLEALLPDAVRQAEQLIREDAQLRAKTAQDCNEALSAAQAKAQQMLSDADRQVQAAGQEVQKAQQEAQRVQQEAQRRAQEEGGRMIAQAQQEAAAIRAKAEQDRNELVSKENVYRVAAVEAEEMRENARKELGQIRQNAFDYLDNVMAEVDRCLSGMVSEVRMERGELNNHR